MSSEANHPPGNCALCVDLDGTLCRTDTLWELALQAFRHNPWAVLRAGICLPAHRRPERLKADLADIVDFNAKGLPWCPEVLAEIHRAHLAGRRVALATASTARVAGAVACELALFDEVFSSTRELNLKGVAKAAALAKRFGTFEYLGDSPADSPVWEAAASAVCVVPKGRTLPPAAARISGMRELPAVPSAGVGAWRLLRPHQWVKNLLVFVPVLTSHRWDQAPDLAASSAAFVSLSLLASAVYCINDVLDAPEDRQHPKKRNRPVASGAVSIPRAIATAATLAGVAFIPAFFLPPSFSLALVAYLLFAAAYVAYLKRLENWDFSTLGVLYMLRMVAGGAATGIGCSLWLLGFACVFFANLAILKRYSEILLWQREGIHTLPGRAYVSRHADPLFRLGVVLSLASCCLVAVYSFSSQAASLYASPHWLLGSAMALFAWDRKMWLHATQEKILGDPVLHAMKSAFSYWCAGAAAIGIVAAMVL